MSTNMDVEQEAPVVVEKAAPVEESAAPPTAVTTPSKKCRLLLGALAVLTIALAIGMGVGLSNKNKSVAQSEEGGYSLPGSTTSTGEELKEPSAQVQEICNSEYMQMSDITCEEACWEANCCYWTGDESCYDATPEICDMWKAAGCFQFSDPFGDAGKQAAEEEKAEGGYTIPGGQVLEDGEVLEEPDSTVETICNSPPYSVSDITCEEACNKAACCYWTGEDSCYDANVDVCTMWKEAGCFNFGVQYEQEDP